MRITKKYISELKPSDIGKMKKAEIVKILHHARGLYSTREKNLLRSGVYSPALEKMQEYYSDFPRKAEKSISRNRAIGELIHLQSFLESATSDVSGARKVSREQDILIFGKSEKGNPSKRMTAEERKLFWAAYDEYKNQNQTAIYRFGSERIIQYFGEIQKSLTRENVFSSDFMNSINEALNNKAEEEERSYNERFGKNVFSGRGSNY